jgi:Putative  PD-(D/E)XK family member, (DUF4420)
MNGPIETARLKAALSIGGPAPGDDSDYRIAASVGGAFLARGRAGTPTLLIPLKVAPLAAGRRGGGFSLNGADRVVFRTAGREWEQAAATLECTDPGLIDAFLVLVADIVGRLESAIQVDWPTVLAWVEEWQVLLARRPTMDLERQLGLWGELWVIRNAVSPDLLVAAWRGPDRDATDFFIDGVGLEVKASRRPHVHHVSQRQAEMPVGVHSAYVLSMWVGIDPARGTSLAEVIEGLIIRVSDAPALLRQVAKLGYAPVDRAEYATRFVQLEAPRWYRSEDVPRVRDVDAGISEVRYVVAFDVDRALGASPETEMWQHFCGTQPTL